MEGGGRGWRAWVEGVEGEVSGGWREWGGGRGWRAWVEGVEGEVSGGWRSWV